MEVGMFDSSVGFIIQARMASTRLPAKVLMPLPFLSKKTLLDHIIDTLNPLGAKVIVATSNEPSSDPIASFCEERAIECFRGDENNVLSRFMAIQEKYQFHYIFRFTADNPLIDTHTLGFFFRNVVEDGLDYAYSKGMPLGMNFEFFRGETLVASSAYANVPSDYEHVTPAIRRNAVFKTKEIRLEDLEELRMTIDTVSDYALMSMLFQLKLETNLEGLSLIKSFAIKYPWLLELNKHVAQNKVDE